MKSYVSGFSYYASAEKERSGMRMSVLQDASSRGQHGNCVSILRSSLPEFIDCRTWISQNGPYSLRSSPFCSFLNLKLKLNLASPTMHIFRTTYTSQLHSSPQYQYTYSTHTSLNSFLDHIYNKALSHTHSILDPQASTPNAQLLLPDPQKLSILSTF